MLASKHNLESFYTHVKALRAADLDSAELEKDIRGELLNMLDAQTMQEQALEQVEQSVEKASTSGELVEAFRAWKFVEIDNPDKTRTREILATLPHALEILKLFNQVVTRRAAIVSRKEHLDKKILSSWHSTYPRFSSMGTLDSALQSETLRDAKPSDLKDEVARR